MYKFENILRKQHMIDKTHLNLEGAKLYFFFTSFGNLYWEQCFWVCVQ